MHADRIRVSLLAVLILAALPFGCTQDLWRWLLITTLGLLFCLFLRSGLPFVLTRRDRLALGLGCAWLVWLGFQMAPVPAPVLARVSPEADRLYQVAVPGLNGTDALGYAYPGPDLLEESSAKADGAWVVPGFRALRPASLYPYGTWRNLLQAAALLGFVVMVLSLFRDRRHQRWLAAAVLGLAAFEAVYGSFELLSGRQHIFGYAKRFYTDSATGTLVNRNHYAALLNLALPMMVALLLERRSRSHARPEFLTARMRWKQAAAPFREPLLLSIAIVTGIAVVLSRSRMGIAAMLVGLLSLSVLLAWAGRAATGSDATGRGLLRSRWVWAAPLLLFAGICLYSLATDALPTMERFSRVAGDLDSGAMRPGLWAETLPVARGALWSGAGSGAYPHALNPALSRLPLADFWDYHHAHNDYLETLATLGLVGALLAGAALAVFLVRRPASLPALGAMAAMATLLAHAAVDFPLAVPSNALLACAGLCLIALPAAPAPPRRAMAEAAPRIGRGRMAACVLVLALVALWPARSTLAAAVAGTDVNTGAPADVRSLEIASTLEPFSDRHARRLAKALLARAREGPADRIVLGDPVGPQALKLRREMLQGLVAAHRTLLECVDLSPVDYTLHAEIAETASNIRALARECGMQTPADPAALASPHRASAALAPTAHDNHAALAALLWKERQALGEPSMAMALELLDGLLDRSKLRYEAKGLFVRSTEDGPSLARLDETIRPGPEAYVGLVGPETREASPALASCAEALKARATVRAAREAIDQKDPARARAMLEAVILGAPPAGGPPGGAGGASGECGEDGLRDAVTEDARRLLLALSGTPAV